MKEPDYVAPTLFPSTFLPHIGMLMVQFGATDTALNSLIWHLLGAGEKAGRAVTSAILNYRPRALLLEQLADAKVTDSVDKKKLVKLAHEFTRVADFRHRLIHDEVYFSSPTDGTVGVFRSDVVFKPQPPTEISIDNLQYMASLSFHLTARMQQYRIKSTRWNDDEHFPWHDKPLPPPRKKTQVAQNKERRSTRPRPSRA